jgi:hypothetical protein
MRGVPGLVILGGVFCAYWFGAAQLLRMAPDQFPERDVQMDTVAVSGFPLRFDIALTRPALPARGWSADTVTLSTASYWPFSATGALSNPQNLAWRIEGPDMPLSIAVTPGMVLSKAAIEGHDLTLHGPIPGRLRSVTLSVSPADDSLARKLSLDLDGLALGGADTASAALRAVVYMSDPPRLRRRPDIRQIDLTRAELSLGPMRAELSGTLERGPDGTLNGALPLTVTNWRALLGAFQHSGLLPPDQAPMVMMMAQSLSNGDRLSLPLTVAGSVISLGPLALLDLGRF